MSINPLDLFSNAVRAKEIVTVLVRHGFGDLLEQLGMPRGWVRRLIPEDAQHLNLWQRIRVVLEDLGPTFVKFGQILSTRPDVLPEPLIAELKLLRSKVKAVPFEQMRPVLLTELGTEPETHFTAFDETPVACGSIGQVYRATLRKNGETVAVKLQRPNLKKPIKADIEIIGWLARLLHEKVEELRPYDLPDIVSETGKGMMQELDFTIECRNAQFFNALNPDKEHVFAPRVYDEFTTEQLSVCEWVEGVPPGDPSITPEEGKELARIGGQSVFQQIVISGFFHADPHGGNILITPDRRLCFIDWGLAGQLTRPMRYFLADLFAAISSSDPEKVVRVLNIMAVGKDRLDETKLEKEIGFVLRKYQSKFGKSEPVGEIVLELLYVFGVNGITLARDYSLLAKAIVSIEESGIELDPSFDIRTIARPYLKKLAYERWNPINLLKQNWWGLQGHFARLRELPGEIQRFFRKLEDGDISIKLKHEGFEALISSFDSGINRLSFSLIIAALLIGSSFIISGTIQAGNITGGLLVHIATLGFVGAGVLGAWLLFDIIRHGRHKKK
ncbi:MAG: AarF/UbiB family protein [Verrucomicrobiota bacterium JB024]|nr:AarF/UbiB family protein [Verrucomicrobiota bacterium JB024]